jgi:hypothetical protein
VNQIDHGHKTFKIYQDPQLETIKLRICNMFENENSIDRKKQTLILPFHLTLFVGGVLVVSASAIKTVLQLLLAYHWTTAHSLAEFVQNVPSSLEDNRRPSFACLICIEAGYSFNPPARNIFWHSSIYINYISDLYGKKKVYCRAFFLKKKSIFLVY